MAKKPTKTEGKTAKPAKAAKPEKTVKAKAGKPAPAKVVKANVEEAADVIASAPMETVEAVVPPKKAEKPPKPPKVKKISAEQLQAQADANKKWMELKEKFGGEKATSYNMSSSFDANTPIQHKTFGWGYVINNENNRLEVLFETGTKHLISNYKS
jgi:hypothetical protein